MEGQVTDAEQRAYLMFALGWIAMMPTMAGRRARKLARDYFDHGAEAPEEMRQRHATIYAGAADLCFTVFGRIPTSLLDCETLCGLQPDE